MEKMVNNVDTIVFRLVATFIWAFDRRKSGYKESKKPPIAVQGK